MAVATNHEGKPYTYPRGGKLKFKNSMDLISRVADLELSVKMAGFTAKEVLTFEEAAIYMGVAKSYLYKQTANKVIPHYKPNGKMVYFNRLELEAWLQSNRVTPTDEVEQQAQAYCMQKGGKL